jgi:hypothetical protein
MSEGPVKFVDVNGVEEELMGAEEAGVLPSNDLGIRVTHDPFKEEDTATVEQRVGDRIIYTTLYPGEDVGIGNGNSIVHEIDL